MPHLADQPESGGEVAELMARYEALRQAAALPGAEPGALLEAAFTELDGAVETLAALRSHPVQSEQGNAPGPDSFLAERHLLRAAFNDAPVPLFLLGLDGTVQRVNASASELLGSQPGYATGKLITAFCDLPSRAAVHSQLAAVARTGATRRIQCRLLGSRGPLDVLLIASLARVRGDGDQLVVAASRRVLPASAQPPGTQPANPGPANPGPANPGPANPGPANPGPAKAEPPPSQADNVVESMIHRYDLATAATRLFLENAAYSESVTLQRCARLLAGELAAWVIVDVDRQQRLRRQFVMGPGDQDPDVAREISGTDPRPGTLPREVFESGSSVLLAHAEDAGILGDAPDGAPVMMKLGATSVLCVPLSDGERCYGALTLARQATERHFDMADLGLVEELGEQLALAMRVDRMFRRNTEITDALQSSLLPRNVLQIPGVQLATAYVAATEGLEVGGDFYDVYRTPDGWGVAIGDVCGKGEEAAAVTAAARHAIRVLAHWFGDPAEVMDKANKVLLAEQFGDRFVTAKNAHLSWRDGRLHVVLGSAGHPGPVLLRADGRTRVLESGGLPLGLFPECEAGREEIDLDPGDVLFFFTDGVTEARSPELEYFEDRLTDELAALAGRPPTEIVTGVRALVTDFCRNELRDDMTMLVLQAGSAPD